MTKNATVALTPRQKLLCKLIEDDQLRRQVAMPWKAPDVIRAARIWDEDLRDVPDDELWPLAQQAVRRLRGDEKLAPASILDEYHARVLRKLEAMEAERRRSEAHYFSALASAAAAGEDVLMGSIMLTSCPEFVRSFAGALKGSRIPSCCDCPPRTRRRPWIGGYLDVPLAPLPVLVSRARLEAGPPHGLGRRGRYQLEGDADAEFWVCATGQCNFCLPVNAVAEPEDEPFADASDATQM